MVSAGNSAWRSTEHTPPARGCGGGGQRVDVRICGSSLQGTTDLQEAALSDGFPHLRVGEVARSVAPGWVASSAVRSRRSRGQTWARPRQPRPCGAGHWRSGEHSRHRRRAFGSVSLRARARCGGSECTKAPGSTDQSHRDPPMRQMMRFTPRRRRPTESRPPDAAFHCCGASGLRRCTPVSGRSPGRPCGVAVS
jgi:hypothetical protein